MWAIAVASLLVVLLGLGVLVRARLQVPRRRYEGAASVSAIYDSWTREGILERYWGEHVHAGHYGSPPVKKDFVVAKVDFVDALIDWGIADGNPSLFQRLERPGQTLDHEPVRILDVGCGIGGSSRHMAKRWPQTAHVTGVTISRAQVQRATALTRSQGIGNAVFLEGDAAAMTCSDASFDVVWSVEMEMHMPDKDQFVREMVRVLKPGGMLVIAAWNVRDTRDAPLSRTEAAHLRLLVDEWAHARFTSIREYIEILQNNGLVEVTTDDWSVPTQPSWRHAVWAPWQNPGKVLNISMKQRWGLMRDAYTTLRYGEAFRGGLCQYGVIRGKKAA